MIRSLTFFCFDFLALCSVLNMQVIYVEYSFHRRSKKDTGCNFNSKTKKQFYMMLSLNTFHNFCLQSKPVELFASISCKRILRWRGTQRNNRKTIHTKLYTVVSGKLEMYILTWEFNHKSYLHDISMLSSSFESISFSFVPRLDNVITYCWSSC